MYSYYRYKDGVLTKVSSTAYEERGDVHLGDTDQRRRRDELGVILYQCAEAVRIASLLLWPVMPGRTEQLWASLGVQPDPRAGRLHELAAWGGLSPGTPIAKTALFPRIQHEPAAAT